MDHKPGALAIYPIRDLQENHRIDATPQSATDDAVAAVEEGNKDASKAPKRDIMIRYRIVPPLIPALMHEFERL